MKILLQGPQTTKFYMAVKTISKVNDTSIDIIQLEEQKEKRMDRQGGGRGEGRTATELRWVKGGWDKYNSVNNK